MLLGLYYKNRMIHIKRLHGTEEELYRLVAPLVMNPAVLKQNNNFPFRTSEKFQWFVALNEEERVIGFVPVECRRTGGVINNYYVENKDADVLEELVKQSMEAVSEKTLSAVSFREDKEVFHRLGFVEEKQWTRYVKMRKEPAHAED